MHEYDNKPNAMDWAKLLVVVMVTLGLGYGAYLSAPYIGKALLSDGSAAPVTAPVPVSPQEEAARRAAAQMKYTGIETKTEVTMLGDQLNAENQADDNVLYINETHCLSATLHRSTYDHFQKLCEHEIRKRYGWNAIYAGHAEGWKKHGPEIEACMRGKIAVEESTRADKIKKKAEADARHKRFVDRKFRKK
jgi:hypothetical protein